METLLERIELTVYNILFLNGILYCTDFFSQTVLKLPCEFSVGYLQTPLQEGKGKEGKERGDGVGLGRRE